MPIFPSVNTAGEFESPAVQQMVKNLAVAATNILTGPGRPDTPASTGGIITGSEPVGAEYRSTDGANVGAWVWMKRPTGWIVTDGDTGWRTLPLVGTGHRDLTRVEVRRQNAAVRVRVLVVPNGAEDGDLATVPQGFRFNNIFGAASAPSVAASIRHGSVGTDAGTLLVFPDTISFYALTNNVQRHLARTDWGADDPWPSTLPGTPA